MSKNRTHRPIRALISGGGTGGHIFPAVSIGTALRGLCPESEILFVGAEGKMEMTRVPQAGFKIVGLPIAGLQRQLTLRNILNDILVPFKMLVSMHKARKIIRTFKPDIAIGVGGYASAPLLKAAQRKGVPTLLQEQNSYAGLTNKMLAKKALKICTAYENMDRFFPADRIVLTGNPVRGEIRPATAQMREEGMKLYGLDPSRKQIFIVGGSLGSRTLNESMKKWIEDGCPGGENVEILWQCGKYYKPEIDAFMQARPELKHIHHSDFIGRMDLAYAVADIVVSRSGASSISELCIAGKATIFVPSPNVAEDHQTHNAMALVSKDAAMLVRDADARETLMSTALDLLGQSGKIALMEKNIALLARPNATAEIAEEVYKLIDR